jgi:hypothetical protein
LGFYEQHAWFMISFFPVLPNSRGCWEDFILRELRTVHFDASCQYGQRACWRMHRSGKGSIRRVLRTGSA